MLTPLLVAALTLSQAPAARTDARGGLPVLGFPTGEVQTLNIIQWDSNTLPKIYERSDQLPLSDEEVAKLSKQYTEALVKGDTSTMDPILADDWVLIAPSGEVLSKDRHAKGLEDGTTDIVAMDPSELEVRVYGDAVGRVPHIVCLGVEGVEPQAVLLGLDRAGIAAHSGSACSSPTSRAQVPWTCTECVDRRGRSATSTATRALCGLSGAARWRLLRAWHARSEHDESGEPDGPCGEM